MANYILPGYAGQLSGDMSKVYEQSAPLFNLYSPRLFGAPPQLTNLCDMRLKSSLGDKPGPVGDFYLDRILRNAQIANIIVGHAVFTGGMSSIASMIRSAAQYTYALSKYSIFGSGSGGESSDSLAMRAAARAANQTDYNAEAYNRALGNDTSATNLKPASEIGVTGADDSAYVQDLSSVEGATTLIQNISSIFDQSGVLGTAGALMTPLYASMAVQQPFYTFEADWATYINNVKMMINAAIMMLGLQDASVRIGDKYWPIALGGSDKSADDVWSNYRFISPTGDEYVGAVNAIDTLKGDTHQYVSFMINPASISENYSNSTTESQIYSSVINMGTPIGNEIAFLTNTSRSMVDDMLVGLTGDVVNTAERVMSALTGGTGRFTAAVAGAMARSYTGEHTIFPKIFQSHSSTTSMSMKVQLRANAGDPYSYLTEILVPMFHLIAMALPSMSRNAASSYSYPPLIQLNIPGVWGTRLGIVQSLQIEKNPEGNDFSVNGYPLAVDVNITVEDLQHVMVTSGMDKPAMMLNNDTMFDYIAQCAGVDKYRTNGAVRIVTKIALSATAGKNTFVNLGHAVLNDGVSLVNRLTGIRNI